MASFNSYELFIIPRLNSFIHNSGCSNSKNLLFVFLLNPVIRHFHISLNALYLRYLHTHRFHVLLPTRNEKQRLCKNLGKQIRCIMVNVEVACSLLIRDFKQ